MEAGKQYYDPDAARRPAPQLTKAELRMMTPEQVVAADEAAQFEVIKTGRDPIDAERRGERWATPDEAQAALQAAAADRNRIRTEARAQARAEGIDVR
jgi:hypothetical protein